MPVHKPAVRTARPGYSFQNQGAAASAGNNAASVGKHVLKRVPGVDLWGPSWGEETVIRPYPARNPDNPSEFDPYRLSNSYCDFGDWVRVYEAVRNFGNPGVTMLLHDGMNSSYDAQLMNPCWILYRAINQALSQGQGLGDWVPLTKGSQGKGAALAKPSKLYLVQCAIFRHKSKDTFGPGQPPLGANPNGGPTIVMALPGTAGEAFIRLLEEKDEDWKGDPDSYEQYKYGDPVGIEQGRFVHIYELGKDPRSRLNTARANNPASYSAIYSAAPSSGRGSGLDPKGYGAFITKTLDGGENDIPASLTGFEDMVKSKIRPWEDILEFKSDIEQAKLVGPLFPASAVMYAWRDHQDWIPDSVRDNASYDAKKPVSSSTGPSAILPGNSWGSAPRPQVQSANPKAGTATWGKQEPIIPENTVVQTDSVVPQNSIESDEPGEESDPLLLSDEAKRIEESRAKLKAANERAAQRRANK